MGPPALTIGDNADRISGAHEIEHTPKMEPETLLDHPGLGSMLGEDPVEACLIDRHHTQIGQLDPRPEHRGLKPRGVDPQEPGIVGKREYAVGYVIPRRSSEIDPEFRITRNHVRPAVARRLDAEEGA